MSKIDKLNTLHQRAERLLGDSGTGIINQPEEVQVAFINGLYKASDLTALGTKVTQNKPVRARSKDEYLLLPKSALDDINRALKSMEKDWRSTNAQSVGRAAICIAIASAKPCKGKLGTKA